MIRLIKAFAISTAKISALIIVFTFQLHGQCDIYCGDTLSLSVANCDELLSSPFISYVAYDGCESLILDGNGQVVPNPIPSDPNYLCTPLTVLLIDGEDTCTAALLIQMEEGPKITPVPFQSVSATNYNLGNVPKPIVEDCTRPFGDPPYIFRVYDTSDDTIAFCNDVPRIIRTYRAYDRCGNVSMASQTFDVIADLSCTIIGPTHIPVGYPTLIKSQINPQGFPPYDYQWSVLGQGWTIDVIDPKTNPQQAYLTPTNPAPGEALVNLDLFDRFGCKRSCMKVFTSIRNNRPFGFVEGTVISVVDGEIWIRSGSEGNVPEMRILTMTGRILYEAESLGTDHRISASHWAPGIYVLQLRGEQGWTSEKFVKP
jgi:hypothetical protein